MKKRGREFLMNHKRTALIVASMITAHLALAGSPPIDRQALVTRHNVELNEANSKQWLQVGNGEIAFGIGVDGLQTFAGLTMSHWGWHTAPLPEGLSPEDFELNEYQVAGRTVRYKSAWRADDPLWNWLRQNPHRMNLGQITLLRDGKRVYAYQLSDIRQTLDLWSGIITSRYTLDGQPVMVETCAHPTRDILAARFESPLVSSNRLSAVFTFPYADPGGTGGTMNKPDSHTTRMNVAGDNAVVFDRRLDDDRYQVAVGWSGEAVVAERQAHQYELKPQDGVFEIVVSFSREPEIEPLPTFAEVKAASVEHWPEFWQSGGAIDLSESKDPRWRELERRIVLSQYLMAVNEAGSLPPQEAGLVNNGWHGKFHLEMHWWHGTHFALWDRWELFDRSLGWYRVTLPKARERARFQGYQGARWGKMVGPDGRNAPGASNSFLIWQNPHPIFYAEQEYRLNPTRKTLEKWREVVFDTADFLASFPVLNPQTGYYEFVQPYHTMPEDSNPPSFELGYWRYGLRTALEWRKRLGLEPEPTWQEVLSKLAPLPVKDGVYWYRQLVSHPGHIGTYGLLPGDGVDPEIMAATVRKVMKEWQADTGWGWDFPMIAMAAARTGQPELAIDALLHPSYKNAYSVVGNNQGSGTAYFPANGGLLYAVAMMAAGWDPPSPDGSGVTSNGPNTHAPGFPDDGSWTVKWEGLKKSQ
jgi:hypothetical protein